MPKLIFQLGNTPELSKRELSSLFPDTELDELQPNIILADVDDTAENLIAILGGTVKIFEYIEAITDPTEDEITQKLLRLLEEREGKITFAIAELGRDHLPAVSIRTLKSELAAQARAVRYLEDSRHGLSAALLLHKKNTIELALIQHNSEVIIAKTVAIQNIDEWSKIDRQKPYADRKKGMLPPKVARMMVNIALGPQVLNDVPSDITIYDPFCGSGTVLLEAILMGVHSVVGSDQDQNSVSGTIQNIEWMLPQYQTAPKYHVFTHDVTRPTQLPAQSITHIVTEPFLGRQTPKITQLENIYTGLERLYLGAFKQWTRFLQDEARIVIIFPRTEAEFHNRTRTFALNNLIDKLAKIGYTTQSEPIIYRRPQAVVQREIYTFIYKNTK